MTQMNDWCKSMRGRALCVPYDCSMFWTMAATCDLECGGMFITRVLAQQARVKILRQRTPQETNMSGRCQRTIVKGKRLNSQTC